MSDIGKVVAILRQASDAIMQLEAEAHRLLDEQQDIRAHHARHLEKTEILISLPEQLRQYGDSLSVAEYEYVFGPVLEFAEEALTAKKLDSIFYMTVLLRPEEEQSAYANTFERFVQMLERRFGN